MPSSRAILADIHDLDLDPTVAHKGVKASGRLAKRSPGQVEETVVVSEPKVEKVEAVVESSLQQTAAADAKQPLASDKPKLSPGKKKPGKKKEKADDDVS